MWTRRDIWCSQSIKRIMIKRLGHHVKVYLATEQTDMRKSINGLAAIVQGQFKLDPFEGAIFVFCNRQKNKIKILKWDKDGFILYYKRRERGKFCWPSFEDTDSTVNITRKDLNRLLDGLIMEQFVPHKNYTIV